MSVTLSENILPIAFDIRRTRVTLHRHMRNKKSPQEKGEVRISLAQYKGNMTCNYPSNMFHINNPTPFL